MDVERRGAVTVATLNRPEKLNAISAAMVEQLAETLWEADSDNRVRVVLLQGAGRAFSAGNDLEASAGAAEYQRTRASIDDDAWWLEKAQRLRMAVWDMHKPVVAKVHGYCLAGATDLALLCDLIVCSDDAVFGFPPVRAQGSPTAHMWTYLVGPQWAKRMLLTGDSISGRDASRIGLVMKSVPPDELDAEAMGLAERLALVPAELLAANKRIVNMSMELMGARTMQRFAAEMDARAHLAEAATTFRAVAEAEGLKAAVKWRDEPFGGHTVLVTESEFN